MEECAKRKVAFEELEEALRDFDSSLLEKYRNDFQLNGGEQFRPVENKVKCRIAMTICDLYSLEYHQTLVVKRF